MTQEINKYRSSVASYATLAQNCLDDVSPGGGNPCQSQCDSVTDGAWESPAADDWVTLLGDIGTRIKGIFSAQDTEADRALGAEPETVEVPGPEEWKHTWEEPITYAPIPGEI